MEETHMKKPFDSLRYRYIAIAASSIFILAGIVMFFAKGFVTGIDFGSGYSEEVRIAPLGFSVSYDGDKNAVLSAESGILTLTMRDPSGVEIIDFRPEEYPLSGDIAEELELHGAEVSVKDPLRSLSSTISSTAVRPTLFMAESPKSMLPALSAVKP